MVEQTYNYVNSPRRPQLLEEWSLYDMLRAARYFNIITDETFQLCNLLRDYRNLIHPAEAVRTSMYPNKPRAQRSMEALRQALHDLDTFFSSVWQEAFIINIAGVPGIFINNPNALQTAYSNVLQARGIHVTIINNITQLSNMTQNPRKHSLILNTHGEIMPVPTGITWQNHYRNLSRAVINHGCILVNAGGYPCWYEANNQPLGADGLNEFLALSNITANCMTATTTNLTHEGRRLLNAMNMLQLPNAILASRCARWQGASKKVVILSNGSLCGLSAIRMGRGWFVHSGLDGNLGYQPPLNQAQAITNDTIIGNLAAGSALLVAGRL
jgi:hypothetical protein